MLADPALVVIVWWPRIEGYTHQHSAACVRGSVSTGGLYECGCSPHGPRPPPSLQKRGRPRGSAGAPYSAAEGPVASTVAFFLRSRVPAWGHGEESGRGKADLFRFAEPAGLVFPGSLLSFVLLLRCYLASVLVAGS